MVKSRFLGSLSELIDDIAESMRKSGFKEEKITEMRNNASQIDTELIQELINIINGLRESERNMS